MPDPSALLRSMASAFERVVKSVVRELDQSRELTPVDSLRSSTSFQPYCLLRRKRSSSWFWRPRYTSVNLSIRDILEPDAPEPGTPPGLGRTTTQRAVPFQRSCVWVGQAQQAGGPQLWSCSSCRVCRSLPLPRCRGRAAGGQCGAGGPRTGNGLRRGFGVWQLQRLHKCVHAASGPQHLDSHAPREVSPQGQALLTLSSLWSRVSVLGGGSAQREQSQVRGMLEPAVGRRLQRSWGCIPRGREARQGPGSLGRSEPPATERSLDAWGHQCGGVLPRIGD